MSTITKRNSAPKLATSKSSAGPTISVSRSDGVNHDLIRVFKSYSDAYDVRDALRANRVRQDIDNSHHMNGEHTTDDIRIHRSDAEHHDIAKAFRSSSLKHIEVESECDKKIVLDINNFSMRNLPVRIVHMADTYSFLSVEGYRRELLPRGNILIHSGNFTKNGKYEEFLQFDKWLQSVSDIYHYRVIVLGENEASKYCDDWNQMVKLLPHATHVLCDSTVSILGLRIHGCPWRKCTRKRSFLPMGRRSRHKFTEIHDIDILVSNEPAYGRMDSKDYGSTHSGNRDLAEAIKLSRPGLHLHGGIPASRGVMFPVSRMPLTLNSSMCDPEGSVLYGAPQVVKCTNVNVAEAGLDAWMFSMDGL
mmetsp:Transcript_9543/g.14358  ORF Transcript_9543/g.14358 Transcript_9543/m.14358 type:complete len:362 (-) Transcript_9543:299-1384(-)|eukprot:CAMPEP_0185019966 /NCGR_PEP_ID=MMETSP1103-20130426/2557_1 /TAXON_ID=36769 /ORGANISM="Paraphysomonas bandaiensis, Strain Caron Lab Isolate" /LENGTH=361 /DNA_ID=CAMNT_0027550565 /DNA_START=41 /DNA_END=1126 /DNA_ORIENTATION=+